ncbi:hypothetical protein SAMD00019534_099630 [Acytostelium subglobosum LB1]|uniref:hypothetical protein n=1 Tax=Acytostelium subglobosum LB1 TaxID=1410327 RepID=UPI0006448799|nr:hypothetical protein SAMD00019534_099630 [Acytostelium subglobosum LB1]GAM26788.1 hypothetical protein SAMD00019534_099630 [Acytostelium subglobosum LB1]|eukprot:XP_012750449.1 hypothetical protein SAMD00019534_099630 [Acytostelium subglobosum LB1]
MSTKKTTTRAEQGPISREYTINLKSRLLGSSFKDRAPKAVKQVRQFAQKAMSTKDVRIDNKLNCLLWSQGIKNVPHRIRVVLSRKRNEDENAREKFYTLATFVATKSFKGLKTKVVTDN